MVHGKSANTGTERKKLAVNLEEHRRTKKKMLELTEHLRRLGKEASTLQEEARHLMAQSETSREIMITVLMADDQISVRNLMQLLLEKAGDMRIVAVASNGQEAVEKAVLYGPDVVVMDISMPILDGVEATRQICKDCSETRVLMTTLHDTPHDVRRSIQAGAAGYLLKDVALKELVPAVRYIHHGNRYFSARIDEIANLYIQ